MPFPVLLLFLFSLVAERQAAGAGLAISQVTEADRTQAEEVAQVHLAAGDGRGVKGQVRSGALLPAALRCA